MVFKIGTTVESDGSIAVIAVPAGWERGGILYWPQHLKEQKLNKLRRDPASIPEESSWLQQSFNVKATAKDFAAAFKMEKILSTLDDTEAEEDYLAHNKLKRTRPGYIQQQQQIENYDELFDDPCSSITKRSAAHNSNSKVEMEQCTTLYIEEQLIAEEALDASQPSIIQFEDSQNIVADNLQNTIPIAECNHSEEFELLDKKISHCVESNIKMHLKMDNLQKTLDKLLNSIGNLASISNPEVDNENVLESFELPILTDTKLCELNTEILKSLQLESTLIAKLTSIAGTSGIKTASKVGLKIVHSVISQELLTNYSWTGRSGAGKDGKMPFMKYGAIVSLFQKVISKADNRFSTVECENFFKQNILKHSTMRLARKLKAIGPESNNTMQPSSEDFHLSRSQDTSSDNT